MTNFDEQGLVSRRARRLGALLARTDPEPRAMALPRGIALRPRPVVSRWQLAAALLLLIAGAAGVPPVRAWIAGTVHSVWLRMTGGRDAANLALAAPPPRPVGAAGSVSFPPSDPLTIRVSARQAAGGTLQFVPAGGSLVTASIVGRSDAAELLIGPEGLHILNRPSSAAGYVIGVPASVSRILVQIGQEPVRSIPVPADSTRSRLDLDVRTGVAKSLKQ